MDISLYELIKNRNAKESVAFITEKEEMTYAKLYEMADRAADALAQIGIRPGDMILAQIVGTPESIALLLACSKIGVCAMMLTEFASSQMVEEAIKTYGVEYVFMMEKFFIRIADEEYVDDLRHIVVLPFEKISSDLNTEKCSNIILWNTFLNKGKAKASVPFVNSGSYDMSICFTSGTSGIAKGIVQTNNSTCNLIKMWEQDNPGWEKGDVFASGFPLYVTSGQSFCIFMPLALGIPVVLNKNTEIAGCYSMLCEKQPNIVVFIKNVWLRLIDEMELVEGKKKLDLSKLKIAYAVGGKLRLDEEEKINYFLKNHGSMARIKNLYGMSEANSVLMKEVVNESNEKVFRAVEGVKFKVMNPCTKEELSEGKIGEIYFKTPALMREYFLNDEKTKEVLTKDINGYTWLISGDLGYKDNNGDLHFIGRTIEKLVYGEDVTYFYEIMDIVMKNPYVKDCCVSAGKPGVQGVVFVILNEHINVSSKGVLDEIMDDLRRAPEIKVLPAMIKALTAFPVSSGGKIDYETINTMID